jgi:adenylylsulfate kinase
VIEQLTSGNHTMTRHQAFCVWLTGLPASGKSTVVAELLPYLEAEGLKVEVLESDEVRRVLTPSATYSREERDLFYRAMVFTGQRLVAHGVTVLLDATAWRRVYRDFARTLIPRFAEVAVECPLAVCMQRDRKGTYQKGQRGESDTVPGLQEPYEAPLDPELRLDTTVVSPEEGGRRIFDFIKTRFLSRL